MNVDIGNYISVFVNVTGWISYRYAWIYSIQQIVEGALEKHEDSEELLK